MMPLRDLIKKRNKHNHANDEHHESPFGAPQREVESLDAPEFVIMRSDTNTQEFISAPTFPKPEPRPALPGAESGPDGQPKRRSFFRRKSSTGSAVSISSVSTSGEPHKESDTSGKSDGRRLSGRIQLGSRSRSASSVNIPQDLPSITDEDDVADGEGEQSQQRAEDREAQWERRATLLAESSGNIVGGAGVTPASSSRPAAPSSHDRVKADAASGGRGLAASPGRPRKGSVSDASGDENIQEAIRLHEAGELQKSTTMFGRLADPDGANNALSQVLYGLALRHGWGCSPDPARGLYYLTRAAQNSAAVESLALQSGMKKGGAAKGELVLAIYELANCFRHGWGVPKKDPVAAKQYYETAANLGDVDAMNEVARCYEVGEGTPKDRAKAAKYYRLAEQNGSKTVGNSWIWKEKYNPK